ncbi:DUF1615 domain-containing protein [Uliginosibacterium sp. H3]|uniref:DUF1615 domain-containing protein n=1 Tax=Uliginosibacterium silvisoli TaxID=3114758 RepID=A0ABU6JZB9_9RHOO|nr:DUF1615 domain-containing protein [Uliginosibacterium sp. H3]
MPDSTARRLPAVTPLPLAFLLALMLSACAGTPEVVSTPAPVQAPKAARTTAPKAASGSSTSAPVAAPRPPLPSVYGVPDAQLAMQRLLPARVADGAGWAADVTNAMGVLHVPMTPENLCATLAVIEQESSFQADPEVPNLSRIVMTEIEARRTRYSVPQFVVDKGLARKSRDGRSYANRINGLRTESDVSRLYEDMFSELPDLAAAYQPHNPINTAGAMQVNVAFAEEHARSKPYPYGRNLNIRRESFTRRGGLYFGVAMLLDYAAPYPAPLYRFADYNSGRFSSRNAAFQNALSRVNGSALVADGDLLIYQDGVATATPSLTQRALERQRNRLGMSVADIRRDLLLEKTERFTTTPLWLKLFALADATAGTPQARFAMPQIAVHSPKFNRTITTSGYALQVDGRFANCMTRQVAGRP